MEGKFVGKEWGDLEGVGEICFWVEKKGGLQVEKKAQKVIYDAKILNLNGYYYK